MCVKIWFCCLLFWSSSLSSYYKDYDNVALLSIYDGDTIKVDLPCKETLFCKNVSVRVRGIDTPELRGDCAYEQTLAIQAKDFTSTFLHHKLITLKDCVRGKYFRIVCDVYANDELLAQKLLEKQLAKPYYGYKKEAWCTPKDQ